MVTTRSYEGRLDRDDPAHIMPRDQTDALFEGGGPFAPHGPEDRPTPPIRDLARDATAAAAKRANRMREVLSDRRLVNEPTAGRSTRATSRNAAVAPERPPLT